MKACLMFVFGLGFLAVMLLTPSLTALESSRAINNQSRVQDAETGTVQPAPPAPTDFLYFKINYVYRPQGQGAFKVLKDGSTLQSGDHYKIIFTPNQDCFVYIFQIDSAKMVYSLFPMEQFGTLTLNNLNPLKAGQTYYLPAEAKSFVLDNQTGTERIYFLASFERDPDLEAEYQRTVEAQQRRDLEAQLQQIDKLLNDAIDLHGAVDMVAAPDETETASWQEDGETFSVLRQRLENMCNGCVHVLTFTHQ